jgi:hypothetical protein
MQRVVALVDSCGGIEIGMPFSGLFRTSSKLSSLYKTSPNNYNHCSPLSIKIVGMILRIVLIVTFSLTLTACSGGGGGSPATNNISHTVSGLSPGTQYYWKVTATDFIDSTDSEVRNFTTL